MNKRKDPEQLAEEWAATRSRDPEHCVYGDKIDAYLAGYQAAVTDIINDTDFLSGLSDLQEIRRKLEGLYKRCNELGKGKWAPRSAPEEKP